MKGPRHLKDEDLLAALSPEAESHLHGCPSCSARRESQLAVRAALGKLSREAPVAPAAAALLESARRSARRRRRLAWVASGAAVVTAAAIAAVVLLRHSPSPMPAPLVDELALDHLHYEHKDDAAQVRGDPATMSTYFASRLGFAPHYGALEAASFEGGKPCRIAGKWTALVWLRRAGHWLSLFTMPEHRADRRGCARAEGVRVCASPDPRGGARVLVGDLSEDEMLRLVDDSLR